MFIVIEGIDGAGCETQARAIYNTLTRKHVNIPTHFLKYPHYDDSVGRMIKQFLYENKNLDAKQQFLLYCLQFINDAKKISDASKKGIVVADRYFTSALCFQTLEGIKLPVALRFASDFKIEKPDFVVYLDVNPDTAIKRKYGEDKEKNRREKDFEFIRKTYKQYDKLVKGQVWTKWVRIDGERNVDEITKDIYNKITNYK